MGELTFNIDKIATKNGQNHKKTGDFPVLVFSPPEFLVRGKKKFGDTTLYCFCDSLHF